MKRPIAISLSPNADAAYVRLATRLLFAPSRWNNFEEVSKAAHGIAPYFPKRFVVPASSGRQALYDLLKLFTIGKGDEVIIQAFTCIAVPEPVLWVGAKPIYADLAQGSYSAGVDEIRAKITPATKCIIVQHTFGIPADIENIVTLAKEHKLILIEDCAHAFGAMYNNKQLGTFGDAAIVSFGRDKCLSSVFGGASIVASHAYAEELQAFQKKRQLPPKFWVVQQLLHPIIFSTVLPIYFAGIGKLLLVLAQQLRLISKAVEFQERTGKRPMHIAYRYSPALAVLLNLQLHDLPAMNARRRSIAKRYMDELRNTAVLLPNISQESDPSWLRFPILVHDAKRFLLNARHHGILLGDWYDGVLVPSTSNMAVFRYAFHSCPRAEETAKHIVNLPTYPHMTDDQVGEVITLIQTLCASK